MSDNYINNNSCSRLIRRTGFFLVLLLVLPVAMISCNRPDYSAEIRGIDSLLNEIETAEKTYLGSDSTILDTISLQASNNINFIKHYYKTDTVNMEDAKIITTYKVLRKVGQKGHQQRSEIQRETDYTRSQLNLLKKWMEEGQTPVDSGKYYYSQEKEATMALLAAYEAYMINLEQAVQLFDSLNPEVIRIINVHREDQSNNK